MPSSAFLGSHAMRLEKHQESSTEAMVHFCIAAIFVICTLPRALGYRIPLVFGTWQRFTNITIWPVL